MVPFEFVKLALAGNLKHPVILRDELFLIKRETIMSSAVQCPGCNQRINVSPEMNGQVILCPLCKSPLTLGAQSLGEVESFQPPPPVQRFDLPPKQPLYAPQQHAGANPVFWILGILGGGCLLTFVALVLIGFMVGRAVRSNIDALDPRVAAFAGQNLLEAREGFQTVILDKQRDNSPPPNPPSELFDKVKFDSPLGEMSAYVSKPDNPNQKHPAIIWIFGGFGNGIGETAWEPQPKDNDQSASAFRQQGIVMMYPALRGGNDNPGFNECFFGEVDDVLAAADYLANQDFVDPDRIYLGGHSTGGTLALLCAAASDQFRAVFAFGPVDNISGYGEQMLRFDTANRLELKLRNPINWIHAINIPTFVIEGSQGNASCVRTLEANNLNLKVDFQIVPGTDHFGVLGPVNELLAQKITQDTGASCNIKLNKNELRKLFD
jgi:dienelactone hydrolase